MVTTWEIRELDNGYIVKIKLDNGLGREQYIQDWQGVIRWLNKF